MQHSLIVKFQTADGVDPQSLRESVYRMLTDSNLFGYSPQVVLGSDPQLDALLDEEAKIQGRDEFIRELCEKSSWEIQQFLEPYRKQLLINDQLSSGNWELTTIVQPVSK